MSKKYKKPFIIGIVILAIVLIISAISNSTYALFSTDDYGTNANVYSTGALSIDAKSKSENISLTNALPMTDEDGLQTNPYVFTIKNVGNLDYKFDVKLLSTGSSDTTFLPQYIKLQIDDGAVTTLSALSSGKIKSSITLLAGESIDISIRIWLSLETSNSELGKGFNSKIVVDGEAVYTNTNNEYRGNAADFITNLYTEADKTTVTNNDIEYKYAPSVGLMNDRLGGTADDEDLGNIRYYGDNPNNYVYFNCSDYYEQNEDTCEVWRIIGVVDGKVKLIRNVEIGYYAWDYNSDGTYDNNWADATLNNLLNDTYYNSGSTTYYSPYDPVSVTVDFSDTGITAATRNNNLISESTWYTNGIYGSEQLYVDDVYLKERTGTNISDGYIGLAYVSDIAYASDLNSYDGLLFDLGYGAASSVVPSTWISGGWTIIPSSYSSDGAWFFPGDAFITSDNIFVYDNPLVIPTLYLDTEVAFNNIGDGTYGNPYQIYF